ncbi:hypothetical protein P7K49_015319 [Saguinus oedipus]|uniref:RING finger protein 207 n=1 Tax=Saguinus oedipus TaxID=9490 RepID=A0ABQ9V9F3_SAGOE|nr:hypothetical protein P7K49_015319 [Saguinus oedipus]
MSGAIFGPPEGPSALDAASVHPLVCPLCHVQYERPCLLDCFHDFCAGCLRGLATDGRLTCPLCQHQTVVKGPSELPPVDRLMQFLVDSSGDGVEAVRCANCDRECSEQAGAAGAGGRGVEGPSAKCPDYRKGLRLAAHPTTAGTNTRDDSRRLRFPRWPRSGSGAPELALGPQDVETTYFCNTCGQPLCARCRDETHRARMFARHDIVALGQRSRDVPQKCSE